MLCQELLERCLPRTGNTVLLKRLEEPWRALKCFLVPCTLVLFRQFVYQVSLLKRQLHTYYCYICSHKHLRRFRPVGSVGISFCPKQVNMIALSIVTCQSLIKAAWTILDRKTGSRLTLSSLLNGLCRLSLNLCEDGRQTGISYQDLLAALFPETLHEPSIERFDLDLQRLDHVVAKLESTDILEANLFNLSCWHLHLFLIAAFNLAQVVTLAAKDCTHPDVALPIGFIWPMCLSDLSEWNRSASTGWSCLRQKWLSKHC